MIYVTTNISSNNDFNQFFPQTELVITLNLVAHGYNA